MTNISSPNQYLSLQYLRAFAALLIVILHLHTGNLFSMNFWVSWMHAGVDIFFVVSGYIMVKSTADRPITALEFSAKRLIRIVPLYWIATLLTVAGGTDDWHRVVYSMLFLPSLDAELNLYVPTLFVGWTLNFEMFFYAIFAVCLKIQTQWRTLFIGAIFIALVFIGTMFKLPPAIAFYTQPIIMEFVFGMAIASYPRKIHFFWIPISLIALAMLHHITDMRLLHSGIPAAILVAACVSNEKGMPKIAWLKILGDASYALYISHLLVLGLILLAWRTFFALNYAFLPIGILGTIGVAMLIFKGFEQPVGRALTRWFTKTRVRTMPDAYPA
jgi:exopolysaccharide production protein ExoZ